MKDVKLTVDFKKKVVSKPEKTMYDLVGPTTSDLVYLDTDSFKVKSSSTGKNN